MSSPSSEPIAQCVSSCDPSSDLCQRCHAQCIGCSGASNQQCVACRANSIILVDNIQTCVPACGSEEYLARISATNTEHECRTCDAQCLNCTGPGNTNCVQCRGVNNTIGDVTTCMETCPEGTFEFDTRLCLQSCSFGMDYDIDSGSCQLTLYVC